MELYKEFRPVDLDSFVGNEHVTISLRKIIDSGDIPKGILFCGPSGVGKTTLARILKHELKCPDYCYRELDAVSLGGVDAVRAIRDEAVIPPVLGKFRMYVFDEAQRLTAQGSDQTLKMIEDAPKHAFYVFTTSDESRINGALRGRCSIFRLHPLSTKDLALKVLFPVIDKKNPELADRDLIEKIAKRARGSARNALTILETVIRNTKEEAAIILDKAGKDIDLSSNLCYNISKGDIGSCLYDLQNIHNDHESVRYSILEHMTKKALDGRYEFVQIVDLFRNSYVDCGRAGLVSDCVKACLIIGEVHAKTKQAS